MIKNDDGTDFLPMKLATVLIVTIIVLTFSLACTLALIDRSSTVTARASAARIAATALAVYAEGCPGTVDCTLTDVLIPGNVRMVVFSSVPTNGTAEWAGTYTIQYQDGSNETHITGVPLCAGTPATGRGGPLVLYSGRYSVRIGIEGINGIMMALIYPEAT
jgi:Flp pilus assembly protein TadG